MNYIGETYINDVDLYTAYNARLIGDSFSNLLLDPDNKEYTSNDLKSQPGKQVFRNNIQPKDRDVELIFLIECDVMNDFLIKRKNLMSVIKSGLVKISVPVLKESYFLDYVTSVSIDPFGAGSKAKITVRFNEPNPQDRIQL